MNATASVPAAPAENADVPRFSPAEEAEVLGAIHVRGDRIMGWILLGHAATAIGLATFYETWLVTALVGGAALAMFFLARALVPRSFLVRCVAGVALQTFVALHIYQLHGLAEMHFFFFTAFTAMILYQDWLSLWPGTLLIIGQHILFAFLHNAGTNLYFFEVPYVGVRKLAFHFGIALVQVVICSYWALLLRRQTLRDAWQRREVERAREAAEQASRAKSTFLANMSHEIRTPMNGVVGMTELVLGTRLEHDQRENLELALDSSRALLQVINDVLDLSKVEAGKLTLVPAPFQPRRVLHDVVRLFRQPAEQRGLALDLAIGDDVPEALTGDAARLRQVLVNLLGNALKYTERGSVRVAAERVASSGAADAATLRFSVRDTGVGIPRAEQARLFRPFEQVGGANQKGGTGLGLAISRELVALMRGEIGIESEPGLGSTFWFTASFAPAAEIAAPTPALPVAARRLRVLVAEDNAVNRRIAVAFLTRFGHDARAVESGDVALEALASAAFDLVLMDVTMPGRDGLETTREIRRREGGQRRTPVVAMTAHAMSADRERCLAAGMDDYLTKPIELEGLAAVLARIACAPAIAPPFEVVPAKS